MTRPLIELPADDAERALAFWQGLLGVELKPRAEDAGAGWEADSGDLRLGVHERGRGPGDSGSLVYSGERWSICRDSEGTPFALAAA